MLTSRFDAQKNLDIELPKASSAPQKEKDSPWVIELGKDGALVLKGELTSIEELREAFSFSSVADDFPSVILRADTKSQHGEVVRVLDVLSELGVTELSIAAK